MGKKLFFTILMVAVAGAGFQNCGGMSALKGNDSKPLQYGGGGGYDGKVFATPALQPCTDDGPVRDRVVIENGKARFLRENCRELPLNEQRLESASFGTQTVTAAGLNLHLEAVPADQLGEFTTSSLGHFAPAVFALDVGRATYFRAIPLGDRVLTVRVEGMIAPFDLKARLVKAAGMRLEAGVESTRTVTAVNPGDADPLNPMPPPVAFGDMDAVFFVQQSQTTFKAVLFTRTGETVTSLAANDLTINASRIAAQPISATRALLWYRRAADGHFAFALLKLDAGVLSLGPETSGTAAPFSLGTSAELQIAFMPVTGGFSALVENGNKISRFSLQISGDDVVYGGSLSDFVLGGDNPGDPRVVGADGDGYLVYTADHAVLTGARRFRFAELSNGVSVAEGDVPDLLDFDLGGTETSPAGALNALVGNQAYVQAGSKIAFLSPSHPGHRFNVELPSTVFQPPSLFGFENKILGCGIAADRAVLTLLSVPQ